MKDETNDSRPTVAVVNDVSRLHLLLDHHNILAQFADQKAEVVAARLTVVREMVATMAHSGDFTSDTVQEFGAILARIDGSITDTQHIRNDMSVILAISQH